MKTLARNLAWLVFWAAELITVFVVAEVYGVVVAAGPIIVLLVLTYIFFCRPKASVE